MEAIVKNKTAKILLHGSPVQLIELVLNFAIQNCQEHNTLKTNEAIQVLIEALNFNPEEDAKVREISINLLRVYNYCQQQVKKQNYDIVLEVLTEIKEAWSEA